MVRLQVIVKALYKRNRLPTQMPDVDGIAGVVLEGFSFLGEEVGPADLPQGTKDKWYRDRDGYYYWGSGLLIIDEIVSSVVELEAMEPEAAAVQTFSWFTDLNIEVVWNQFQEQGEEVTIAILDTGYDLANDDLKEAVIGVRRFDIANSPAFDDVSSALMNDQHGHGTFCASILANRNKKGTLLGIAPKCKLLVGKISEDDGLDPEGLELVLDGIEWAISKGADIISISFGKFRNELPSTDHYFENLQTRLDQILLNHRVLIFASSGDNRQGQILTKERYPASFNGCVSVGATNQHVISPVTVLSPNTIIHAQGEKVESYWLNKNIVTKTGTSMSTPIVAGVAALAVSHVKKSHGGSWVPAEVLQKVYDSGSSIPTGNKKEIFPTALFNTI